MDGAKDAIRARSAVDEAAPPAIREPGAPATREPDAQTTMREPAPMRAALVRGAWRGLARSLVLGGPPAAIAALLVGPAPAAVCLLAGLSALPAAVVEAAGAQRVRSGRTSAGRVAWLVAGVVAACATMSTVNLIYLTSSITGGPLDALDAVTGAVAGLSPLQAGLVLISPWLWALPFVIAAAPGPRAADSSGFEWGGMAVGQEGLDVQERFMRAAALLSLLVGLVCASPFVVAAWRGDPRELLSAPAVVVLVGCMALAHAVVTGGLISLGYEVADRLEARVRSSP